MDFNLTAGAFSAEKNFSPLDVNKTYDVLIIGGGPAGLTAAVYCMRKGVSTGVIIKEIGGQVAWTAGIENYMGYRHISGIELVDKFREQVLQFGIDFDEGSVVTSVEKGKIKKVILDDGRVFAARALIVATGKDSRKLGVPGEVELLGRGVAYCAICDAPFFAGKKVIVVGGGNSGLEAAIDLCKVADHVTIVQFLEELTADMILVDKLKEFTNMEIIYSHEIVRISGSDKVESVTVKDRKGGSEKDIAADGIFVEIGLIPNSGPFKNILLMNDDGEIKVDCSCRTSEPGVFAAGDVTDVPFKQIIVAGGEGAKAALAACSYVLTEEK